MRLYYGMSDAEIETFVAEFLARIEDGSLKAECKAGAIERHGEAWEAEFGEASWEQAISALG